MLPVSILLLLHNVTCVYPAAIFSLSLVFAIDLCLCFQAKFILKQPHFGSDKEKGRFSLAGWKDTGKVAETTANAGRALTGNGCDCWFS